MNQATRVAKDITMYEENRKRLPPALTDTQAAVTTIAHQYYEDTKYYHHKKDYFTAFGCINYAHGLLDAILKTTQEQTP